MKTIKKNLCLLLAILIASVSLISCKSNDSIKNEVSNINDPYIDRLNNFAKMVNDQKSESFGYPDNQNVQLADLQNLDLVLMPSDEHGRMIPEEFEKLLVKDRPALMVYAMGTTFKGGIDDQDTINAILDKYPSIKVYRHVDAALFGGLSIVSV